MALVVPFHTPVGFLPTEVSEEAVTPEFNVFPVNVPAAAVTVIAAVPSKTTPLIALAVAKAVAVSALPSKAPSNLVASISPEALNMTPSPAPTLNII